MLNYYKNCRNIVKLKLFQIYHVQNVTNNIRCATTVRSFSSKDSQKKYSDTVLLPKTDFPVHIQSKDRAARDEYIAKTCEFDKLYDWQRNNVHGPEYVLHDGPPYANGPVHLGHAVNKILKDITNRERLLAGYKIHYIPGWDCHGLPIELSALGTKRDSNQLTDIQIRKNAREISENAIKNQMNEFKSWGVMSDWNNPYITSSPEYIKNELRCFQSLYDRGLIFRDLKPVYWSPGSKTALAEAELVYNSNHSSLSVFVQTKLTKFSNELLNLIAGIKPSANVLVVAWTSTSWSLPANKAIAYGDNLKYCLVENPLGDLVLINSDLLNSVAHKLDLQSTPLVEFSGKILKGCEYESFFGDEHGNKIRNLPLIHSDHVTNTAGTGLVHIAPSHGHQDFLLALKHKLPLEQILKEDMCYTNLAPKSLQGLNILKKTTTDAIFNALDASLMYTEPFIHSYPYDWRVHCPVIILASHQWFLSTDALRQKAEECLSRVQMYPSSDPDNSPLLSLLRRRPYWCISRQRVWGTPIPVVYNKKTGQAIIHKDIIERICKLIDEKGTDCWWTCEVKDIVPENVLDHFKCTYDQLEKGKDILDIWIDSGLSWSYILGQTGQSDICIEGVDQYTGWFQSSLLLSAGLQAREPYRSLLTHGFVVDKDGLKMSKSVGNVIHPKELTHGTKNKPALGIDVLRCWVATQAVGSNNTPASPTTFQAAVDIVSRLRKMAKFILGNIKEPLDYSIDTSNWRFLDRLMLHRLYKFHVQANKYYLDHQLHNVMKSVVNFVAVDISSDYCHLVKDRLYCDDINASERQNCIHVLTSTLEIVLRAIGPILPHLSEEICMHWPGRDKLFFTRSIKPPFSWNQPELEDIWEQLQGLRKIILSKIDENNSQMYGVTLEVPTELYTILKCIQENDESWNSELCDLFQVAGVALQPVALEEPIDVDIWKSPRNKCLRCRRFTALPTEELCERCTNVITRSKLSKTFSSKV